MKTIPLAIGAIGAVLLIIGLVMAVWSYSSPSITLAGTGGILAIVGGLLGIIGLRAAL